MGSCDKLVSKAQELVEEGDSSGIAGGGGKVDRELNTLLGDGLINPKGNVSLMKCRACRKGGLLGRLIDRLVSHNQELKVIASLLDGLDEFLGKQSLGDLSALRHHGNPRGKLGVILGECN